MSAPFCCSVSPATFPDSSFSNRIDWNDSVIASRQHWIRDSSMFEMIPLGWFHTIMGIIALASGGYTLSKFKEITIENRFNKLRNDERNLFGKQSFDKEVI
jgi:polygalacturonase